MQLEHGGGEVPAAHEMDPFERWVRRHGLAEIANHLHDRLLDDWVLVVRARAREVQLLSAFVAHRLDRVRAFGHFVVRVDVTLPDGPGAHEFAAGEQMQVVRLEHLGEQWQVVLERGLLEPVRERRRVIGLLVHVRVEAPGILAGELEPADEPLGRDPPVVQRGRGRAVLHVVREPPAHLALKEGREHRRATLGSVAKGPTGVGIRDVQLRELVVDAQDLNRLHQRRIGAVVVHQAERRVFVARPRKHAEAPHLAARRGLTARVGSRGSDAVVPATALERAVDPDPDDLWMDVRVVDPDEVRPRSVIEAYAIACPLPSASQLQR